METLKFLTREQIEEISRKSTEPTFVYSETELEKFGRMFLNFPNAYGLTVRYAMKASPNRNIIKIFHNLGIQIDASSGYEVTRAMNIGVPASDIQLTAQEFAHNLDEIIPAGTIFNACSLYQLEEFGKKFPGTEISLRVNPGVGSGGTRRTNVGGPSSSFGIWNEYMDEAKEIAQKYNLKITRIHTHIGSGSDPMVWAKVSQMSLDIVKLFPDVTILNLGGGFKIARMDSEVTADLQSVGAEVKKKFEAFYEETGRKLHMEIEPGTYLVANACSLVCQIQDIMDTGAEGYSFLKLNSGMTEVTRPSMYGSQHSIFVINDAQEQQEYVVTGHCCESGDIWTPINGDPEGIAPRMLNKAAIGDIFVIDSVGAYCSSMSTKNYNSFPEASELLIRKNGDIETIRERQLITDIWKNEVEVI